MRREGRFRVSGSIGMSEIALFKADRRHIPTIPSRDEIIREE